MPDTCCTVGCQNKRNTNNPEVCFYRFPSDKTKETKECRKKWIAAVNVKNGQKVTPKLTMQDYVVLILLQVSCSSKMMFSPKFNVLNLIYMIIYSAEIIY